jgi:hypothetical protein
LVNDAATVVLLEVPGEALASGEGSGLSAMGGEIKKAPEPLGCGGRFLWGSQSQTAAAPVPIRPRRTITPPTTPLAESLEATVKAQVSGRAVID